MSDLEIDIMEMIGGAGNNDRTVHGTAHWSDNGAHAQFGDSYTLNSGVFADEFHVFSVVWNANGITWLVDNVVYNTLNTTPAQLAEFQEKFFFIFKNEIKHYLFKLILVQFFLSLNMFEFLSFQVGTPSFFFFSASGSYSSTSKCVI